MRFTTRSTCALLMGASAAALVSGAALAQTATSETAARRIETIVVTAQKREDALQDVPIAVSAFGQDNLDKLQIDGGPNLQLAIPNVTFAKGNFTGSNFQIRGIGTKLISATADAAVGVHQNGVPLTQNLLFEAEFYDMQRVEVLRGPQGTLYGRNATGGVINIITAKPDPAAFSGSLEATLGNYNTRKLRGAVNVPLGDNFAIRVAGTTTQRDGFGDNLITGNDVDNRDLYAFRITAGGELNERFRGWVMYEKFEEDDNRVRASKQLCRTDPTRTSVGGVPILNPLLAGLINQGCLPGSLYAPEKRGVVNSSATLGGLLGNLTGLISGNAFAGQRVPADLRDLQAAFDPIYRAGQELYTVNLEFDFTPELTLTYLGSYNESFVFSNEDYNKVSPNAPFNAIPTPPFSLLFPGGFVNDPQLGRSNVFRTFDISSGNSEQTTHELRLQSSFDGPLNFNIGGIKIDFETVTDYYVFSNTLTANAQLQNFFATLPAGAIPGTATGPGVAVPVDPGTGGSTIVSNVTDQGRNYFLSRTPYTLDAYALFGEVYWDVTDTFKATVGLRYTSDSKEVINNLTALLANVGTLPLALTPRPAFLTNPVQRLATTENEEVTGRAGFDWKPELGFTDDTLIYAFYSRGYKGGGVNPPPAVGVPSIRPTYEPEFINSIEIGTKNTLFDGTVQANATVFFYDYGGYQVSKIVNRTSLNENIDAEVRGFEFEGIWNPLDNLTLNLTLGILDTEIVSGDSVDLLDLTQGNPALTVLKASDASNCAAPTAGLATLAAIIQGLPGAPTVPGVTGNPTAILGVCSGAFAGLGITPSGGVPVKLSGKELPNSPKMTLAIGAEYTFELGGDWELTARADYYWQDEMYSRIYNTISDRIDAYSNVNLTLILNNFENGVFAEAFVKNLADDDTIVDAYLTDDSSGLFQNVFLSEPRLIGVTIGKRW